MTEWITLSHSIWTVIVFLLFIGITLWAWDGRRKDAFDKAAQAPLDEDDDNPLVNAKEKNRG